MTGSTVYQMKHVQYTKTLAAGLARNTHLKSLTLSNCGLTDADAELLAEALTANSTLLSLGLEGNSIKDAGCSAIARALGRNHTLREINIFGQPGRWGEACLDAWLSMYETNVTLLKIVWRTDSKKTVALTGRTARNTDINRALQKGGDYVKLLPPAMRGSPPALSFYKVPDVKSTRGGVAAKANEARQTRAGMVMRNGVADKVCSCPAPCPEVLISYLSQRLK